MTRWAAVHALFLLAAGLLAAACGGDGGSEGTPREDSTPMITVAFTATPSSEVEPPAGATPITPPLEGPPRGPAATEPTNFWELPEFQMPSPEDLPEPPGTATGPEFQPPTEAECPADWEELRRPGEGFRVCYPGSWQIRGHGYVSAGVEDRWYSVGIFLFEDQIEVAHVSIYMVNAFARPFTYTRDCDQPYRVTFAGESAVLCPDHPGQYPEAKIVSYHVRRDDLDYFVNVVPHFRYDHQAGVHQDVWSQDAETTAIHIAHTFEFIERPTS